MKNKIRFGGSMFFELVLLYVLSNSCTKETVPQEVVKLGDTLQGGIVAYILLPGDPGYDQKVTHGIIAGPKDTTQGILPWSVNDTLIMGKQITGAVGTSIGTGLANTEAIVVVQGEGNYAAKFCFDLEYNGYSDWFLPSKDELNILNDNALYIRGFTYYPAENYYWSSSEYNGLAWMQVITPGFWNNSILYPRDRQMHVRCIRYF